MTIENTLYDGSSFPLKTEYTLKRPRIHALLEGALDKPLVMVIGGAGYGKTKAVSAFLESDDRNVVWLQLSRLDNDVSRLWERIVHGFRPYGQEFAHSLEQLGYPESVPAINKFLRLVAKAMQNTHAFTIVLDDFHMIHEPAIISFVETLVTARVHHFSVILISRVNLKPYSTHMLFKDQTALITEDDLRFTLDETKAYYDELLSAPLSDQNLLDISKKADGWILAIHLIGLSILKRGAYTQTREYLLDIYDLIYHEIYAGVSSKFQHFLIKLAILDDIPRPLLTDLSLQEGDILQEMAHKYLLIRYDAYCDSYFLHPMLRDFLLERKYLLTDEQIADVHRSAAKWLEKSNRILEAISLYMKCDEYDKVFDIIFSMERTLPKSTTDFLLHVIENVPETLLTKPIVQLLKVLYLFIGNHIERANALLTNLRSTYERLPNTNETQAILGEIYMLLALTNIVNQNDAYVSLFNLADLHLPNGSALVDHRLNIAEGINITGIKCSEAGELSKKHDNMMQAMPLASKVMNGCLYGAEYLNAADSCFMVGDIEGAVHNAFEAILRAKQKYQYGVECMANFLLMRIYVLKGDYTKVMSLFAQIEENLNVAKNESSLVLYDIMKGWTYVKFGVLKEVPQWILSDDLAKEMLSPVIVGRDYLVRSDALLVKGQYHQLLAFMEHTDIIYKQRGILYAVIQNEITRSIIYHNLKNPQASVRALNNAYALSSPNNLILQYIEYGRHMRTVLSAAKRSDQCIIPTDWLDTIMIKSSTYAKQLARVSLAYKNEHSPIKKSNISFSKREKELIICLSNGLTRAEMASYLGVSINTVKSTLQSVYSKLGASNSADAVRIASAEELID